LIDAVASILITPAHYFVSISLTLLSLSLMLFRHFRHFDYFSPFRH